MSFPHIRVGAHEAIQVLISSSAQEMRNSEPLGGTQREATVLAIQLLGSCECGTLFQWEGSERSEGPRREEGRGRREMAKGGAWEK